ncbi:hypothetical protein CCL09_24360 [Pseudomonas congelans]|nr:hypothetical protein CCL07_00570 [Pseudomonas congelans]PBQ13374.1 hypothetical protein CCL09_24360 [Pseudomonas congelans]
MLMSHRTPLQRNLTYDSVPRQISGGYHIVADIMALDGKHVSRIYDGDGGIQLCERLIPRLGYTSFTASFYAYGEDR